MKKIIKLLNNNNKHDKYDNNDDEVLNINPKNLKIFSLFQVLM